MEKGGVLGPLSKHLFWDVDAARMDAETHRGFIIPRVMDRGTRSEVQAVWNQYGADTVKARRWEHGRIDAARRYFS